MSLPMPELLCHQSNQEGRPGLESKTAAPHPPRTPLAGISTFKKKTQGLEGLGINKHPVSEDEREEEVSM